MTKSNAATSTEAPRQRDGTGAELHMKSGDGYDQELQAMSWPKAWQRKPEPTRFLSQAPRSSLSSLPWHPWLAKL